MPDNTAVRSRRVRGDGVDLAVFERGDGPTLLLVHGYPDTHAVWDGVADRLAGRFHVVAYDVRGAGSSARPRDRAAYRFPHLVADMAAVLDAVSPGAPVHLAGHDWGSIQSWEAVHAMPARFASFTSISGPCLGHADRWMGARLRRVSGLPAAARQLRRSWYIAAFRPPVLPELFWTRWLARRWAARLRRAEGVRVPGHPAPTLLPDALAGLNLYRANMLGPAHPAHRVGVRTQVVVPLLDAYVTPALAAGAPEPFVADLRVETIRAPHWAPLTVPGEIAGLVAAHAGGPA